MTRSELASKILSETPPEVREKVRKYHDEVIRRNKEVEAIELTDEETNDAIRQAKIAKWNAERNAPYWDEAERRKP